MSCKILVLAYVALLAIRPALAADDAPARCLSLSSLPVDEPGAVLNKGIIVGKGPAYFLRDGTGCPEAGQTCRPARRPYLVPGNAVAVDKMRPGFACVHFSDRRSETNGWLPADRVQSIPPTATPQIAAWVGTWRLRDNKIRLEARDNRLRGTGEAVWQGRTSINTGDFEAEATPSGDRLEFTTGTVPDGCRLSLKLVGDLLAVVDNRACGGLNVTFSGLYARAR